ncbi:6599_t:CDS:2 [Cetraspora pellucida]|uniref:6599_t:CDS:1 n=1 Tax=Cetraspora pellucida TaxID=1433469 RepID=A0A9N9EFD3_9GLOM|nr:6599_t:CDS:2 [Cetraspora pellucida]
MELILNNISYSEALNIKDINTFDSIIKSSLPSNYKYMVDLIEQISSYEFLGAYEKPFKSEFHIDINTFEDVKSWLQQFMDLHKVTIHVTSFRPVSVETKNAIFKLFDVEHGPNSAYHTYWEQMQLRYKNDEEMLADRALFPHKNDIKYLYKTIVTSI